MSPLSVPLSASCRYRDLVGIRAAIEIDGAGAEKALDKFLSYLPHMGEYASLSNLIDSADPLGSLKALLEGLGVTVAVQGAEWIEITSVPETEYTNTIFSATLPFAGTGGWWEVSRNGTVQRGDITSPGHWQLSDASGRTLMEF